MKFLDNLKVSGWLKFAWPWLVVLTVWQLLSGLGWLNTAFISSPANIFRSFGEISFIQVLGVDVISSLSRLIFGLIFGYVLSLLLVYIGFWIPVWHQFLSSINSLWKYLPAPVLIPLSILAFGLTDSAKVAVVAFTALVLYLSHVLSVLEKDYSQYTTLANSWNLDPNKRFFNLFLPQSNFLSYRVISSVVLWSLATTILTELILGGKTGFGVRLLQFQQLYQTQYLYAYLLVILALAFILESSLTSLFSRFRWDLQKVLSAVLLSSLVVGSIFWQAPAFLDNLQNSNQLSIVSYTGVLNLPTFVMIEKYNSLGLKLDMVGGGLQAMDTLQAKKSAVGGYSDIPNALQALQTSKNLKLLGQVVETPTLPTLFLVADKELPADDFSYLKNSEIGYFPNNPIIQQGLDFVLFTKKVRTSSLTYISGGDPSSLVQALTSQKIKALVTFEPYIQDVEEKLGTKRVNPNNTLITTIKFTDLPLAGLLVDVDRLSFDQQTQLSKDIDSAIAFIRENLNSKNRATGELAQIMEKYSINKNSQLPKWQTSSELKSKDLLQIISILKTYRVSGFENLDAATLSSFYWQTELSDSL